MSDIQKIKGQLNKIKSLVKSERDQDKRTINKLISQLSNINGELKKLEKTSNKIKGGKLRAQKGGACGCLKDIMMSAGNKKRRRRSKRKRGGMCGKSHKKKKH